MELSKVIQQYIPRICEWGIGNLNWIVPMLITAAFSYLNLKGAHINQKMAETQVKLQNASFCYQLFDRRLQIYTNMKEVLSQVIADGRISNDLFSKYVAGTRETAMLFGPEVVQKVDEIRELLAKFHVVSTKVDYNIEHPTKVDPNHSALCDQDHELMMRITKENTDLMQVFESYISFKDYKIEPTEKVKK